MLRFKHIIIESSIVGSIQKLNIEKLTIEQVNSNPPTFYNSFKHINISHAYDMPPFTSKIKSISIEKVIKNFKTNLFNIFQ